MSEYLNSRSPCSKRQQTTAVGYSACVFYNLCAVNKQHVLGFLPGSQDVDGLRAQPVNPSFHPS